ncbi:NADP-dependent oxidoreductase [Sphingomonas sp. S2-65]|uniref:NADP-dependent oxidoreductase n=1 Tax=Sphingomonas sp. S2-65 TaxID=2903960 RepID=UPI001F3891A3|nr:NADP-dependent oxidoreductase [Sphingomonas sp. S2-65]UYY58172.1 NADP-dependent oxidoreductase [Sphingomonas sp. S2-65]
MKAVRVHAFGGLEAMIYEEVPRPIPGAGQVLVKVAAAGVGPWDLWVRSGRSVLPQPLPLTLGADLSGVVEATGAGVTNFAPGSAIYGATNARFTGAYAEYAIADASMIAERAIALGDVEAASVPVIACTALQMVFEHAGVDAGQTVVVIGGAGNVGAYAVQLALLAGAQVVAIGRAHELDRIAATGAVAVEAGTAIPERFMGAADAVIDTVGGDSLADAFAWLRTGGVLVSSVAEPDQELARRHKVRAQFMLVAVTTHKLIQLADLFAAGDLQARVGAVLELSDARRAHAMIEAGTAPPGKLVLVP